MINVIKNDKKNVSICFVCCVSYNVKCWKIQFKIYCQRRSGALLDGCVSDPARFIATVRSSPPVPQPSLCRGKFCLSPQNVSPWRWMSCGCVCEIWRRGRGRRARSWPMKTPCGRSGWQRRPSSTCRRSWPRPSRCVCQQGGEQWFSVRRRLSVEIQIHYSIFVSSRSLSSCLTFYS